MVENLSNSNTQLQAAGANALAQNAVSDSETKRKMWEMQQAQTRQAISAEALAYADRNSAENLQHYAIPQEMFDTPNMGDFYLGGVDDMYLRKLDHMLRGDIEKVEDAEAKKGDGKKAVFYTEAPAFDTPGTDNNGHYFFKVTTDEPGHEGNWFNGKTLRVRLDALNGNGEEGTYANTIKHRGTPCGTMKDNDYVTISLYGINCPVASRMAFEENVPASSLTLVEAGKDTIDAKPGLYVCAREPKDGEIYKFVKIGGRYHQYIPTNEDGDTRSFKWVMAPATGEGNPEAATAFINRLTQKDVYVMLDGYASSPENDLKEMAEHDPEAVKQLKEWSSDDNPNCGYRLLRQIHAGSLSGTAYIKVDGKWVNLAKALIADKENTHADVDKNFTGGSDKKVFKNNYDPEQTAVADGYFRTWDELDDRKKIQQKVLGKSWNELQDWTVTIGDTTLMIPPTSITVQNSSVNDSMPILRARGSMPVGSKYSIRTIQMSIFFSHNDGINGYKITETAPNGTKMEYSINGLRALISQFHFTPFLPIENTYLNEVLGIKAVMFETININTVPGMPQLMQVNLYLREFNYEAYIPEVALLGMQMDVSNPFAIAFNWKTMRYYYQRALMAGDKLRGVGYDINTKEYMIEALKQRTAFQPMLFENSGMKFFIADANYLDKMLASKKDRERNLSYAIQFTPESNEVIHNIGEVAQDLKKLLRSSEFLQGDAHKALAGIHADMNKGYSDFTSYIPPNSALVTDDGQDAGKIVTDFCSQIKETLEKNPNVEGCSIFYRKDNASNKVTFGVAVKIKGVNKGDVIKNLRGNMAPLINASEEEASNMFANRFIEIPFSVYPDPEKNSQEHVYDRLDTSRPEARVWDYALNTLQNSPRVKNDGSGEASTDGWMKAPLIAQLDNMRFRPIDTGVFHITSISASLRNTFSNVHLQESGKSCAQFLGGQDIEFNVSIMTTDKNAVKMIESMPDYATMMMRKYRQIIPCYPIKVDSEFTRFLGVSEVMIDNVTVNTVDNHPGTYQINLIMKSMDRTLRNRESAEMIQANNGGYRASSFADDIADWAQGKKNRADVYQAKKMKSYFEIETAISHAELYPDLELPTLAEMSTLGYDFIRYKFQDNRTYVDPDFYFVYLTRLSSQILRETIINSVQAGIDGTRTLTDASGAQYSMSPAELKGFDLIAANSEAKRQTEFAKAALNSQYELNAKGLSENLRDKSRVGAAVEDYDAWEINNDIRVVFMENRYKKEAESYDARKKADDAKDSFEQPHVDATNDTSQVKATDDTTQVKSTDDTTQVKATDDTSQVPGTQKGRTMPEGAWVIGQLANANTAAEKIAKYLTDVPITLEAPKESACRNSYFDKKQSDQDLKPSFDSVKADIRLGVGAFLSTPEVIEIFELLNIDRTEAFRSITEDIVFAAACSASGSKEYSSKKKAIDWMPSPDYMGVKVPVGTQNMAQAASASTLAEAIEEASMFGAFNIRQYTPEEFLQVTGENPVDVWSDEEKEKSPLNASRYLLDRYYRYQPVDTIRLYKQGCINSPKYCAFAYMRNMLYWLRRLILKRALPSINGDILRKVTKAEGEIRKAEERNKIPASQADAELRDHMTFFTKNAYAIDAGKMWVCSMLALSDGNKMLRDRIDKRDYRGLNEYLHGVSVPSTPVSPDDKLSTGMRKSNLALAGVGRQENKIASGVRPSAPSSRKVQQMDNQLYIKAADDPKQYMMHSCHDMIVYDARGRMLRAFPTYYMMLIDEGRELGSYKLHDNFYNSTNILSFDVIKDRKNPADTANIVLTNIYQSETTEEDTRLRAKESSAYDVFRSMFSPSTLGEDEEEKRTRTSGVLDQLNLRAGARIHLRAGYGSNAAMLPIIFNGSIAEINAEATINIVAQGDGVELTNPIMEEMEGHEIGQDAKWLSNGNNPKDIINDMLTTEGGWIARTLKNFGRPDLLGDNPYGIYHFGDKDFKDIIASGEPTQNIFDALPTPVWDEESDGGALFDQAPSISFDVFGKSPWDVINICRSVMPDFIAAVAPFDFRSTVFVGAPRYYYAYSYMSTSGVIREKRKPFQQFHVYSSACDIIGNGITATSQNMKTTATGLYQVAATANNKEQHKVGPLYADFDIYPENQKSMIVDTQLYAKGVPYIGACGLNFLTSFEIVDELFSNDEDNSCWNPNLTGGHNMNAKSIAWRMTASALKDSMKEMYAGDLVILGDTSVKPHDRISINDTYTGISGQCTVKEVVHHMSLENGFITTISPDCINTVQDKSEAASHHWYDMSAITWATHTAVVGNILRIWKSGATKASDAAALKQVGQKFFGSTIAKAESLAAKNSVAAGAWNLAKAGGKLVPKAAGMAVSAGEKLLTKLATRAAAGALIGSVVGPLGTGAGLISGAALAIAETVVIETVGNLVTNLFKKHARNLQVITLYPLKRYGRAWVAGIAGTKGMVYGTPSFGDNGPYTKIFNGMTGIEAPGKDAQGEALGVNTNDPSMAIANFSAAIFDDPEVWSMAKNSAAHKAGTIDENGDPTMNKDDFNESLRTSFSSPQAGAQLKNDYRAMQMTPRADFSKGNEVLSAYKHFAMLDINKYLTDPKLKNFYLISSDNRLRPYSEEGFFKIIHETPALNEGAYVDSQIMRIRGEETYVKVIKYKLDNGAIVYDVPLLSRDALNILYEIIRRAKNYMPAANSSDPYESYEQTKSSFIALESALRIGDTQSLAAAGHTFILQGVDNAVTPLASAIKDLQDEIKADAEKNGLGETALFDVSVDSTDKTKVAIVVRMAKVSGNGEERGSVEQKSEKTESEDVARREGEDDTDYLIRISEEGQKKDKELGDIVNGSIERQTAE